jgi:hypothetical protein
MYSHCLFCRADLGCNDTLEIFPTGRRLAFDPVKGRLWAVCPKCDRWNLTPIEERYEVLELCEEHFRGARTRVSTDNVGVARVSPALDLVRIGRALRPEFASWRYGPRLRRRRLEMAALIGASVIVATGIGIGGVWMRAFGVGAVSVGAYGYGMATMASHHWRRLARVDTGEGRFVDVRGQDLRHARLRDQRGECAFDLRHRGGTLTLHGSFAVAAARAIMPWTNRAGGSARQVATAVKLLEEHRPGGWPAGLIADAAGVPLSDLAPEQRLAIEMASNEDVERQALEGELELIERAWRDAEEVAAIADNLLVPRFVEEWLNRRR